jgi:type I restriction enzyme S subunit
MQTVAGVGGSLVRARVEGVREIFVPLPPLEEQKRIAAILDQADALRRLRQRAIERLNGLAHSIFFEMFGVPVKGNEAICLKDIVEIRSSLSDPTTATNRNSPHVSPEHISNGGGRIIWESVRTVASDGVRSGKYKFDSGSVLYSKIRPYLNKVALPDREGLCSADMYVLDPIENKITRRFLKYLLMQDEFLRYAHRAQVGLIYPN